MTIEDAQVPALSPGYRLQWEEVQQCDVLLYPEGMVRLNAAQGEVLAHCDGSLTADGVAATLTLGPNPALDRESVLAVIADARARGWVVPT